jgi:hypothetical protein
MVLTLAGHKFVTIGEELWL